MKFNKQKFLRFLGSMSICFGAAFIGGLFTASSIADWYQYLAKPSFSPPSWVFGPVWTLLYLLMGISLYLIWEKGLKNRKVKDVFILFIVHIFFNVLWSVLFFGLRTPFLAFADIIVMWITLAAVIVLSSRLNKYSPLLLIPYLFWISFALLLNFSIWKLNA